jgi:uncharacterized protein (TIGR02391 family)
VAAAAPYVRSQHYASAVFESVKAVVNRVKSMTGLDSDGVPLMNQAFSAQNPRLVLGATGATTQTNVQAGYRELFVGAVQAIRNPSAHEPMAALEINEALELLSLASLLIRGLRDAGQAVRPLADRAATASLRSPNGPPPRLSV